MRDRYAVIGNPVEHSKSPLIHAAFARQTGQDIEYTRILAPLDGFQQTVTDFFRRGGRGANVTVPFKFEAYDLAVANASERAHDAGAANTLMFEGGKIICDNTDGVGLVTDIQNNLGIAIQNKRVLLIGAGGAAGGVLHPIFEQQPAMLVIANRTLDKAMSMKKKVEEKGEFRFVSVAANEFDELDGQSFDIVINATSAGLTDSILPIPPGIFVPGALAYDMMYGHETPFMAFARQQGAEVVDGLGMLVEQAAVSFSLWRGVQPETKPVIAQLRHL